MTSVGSLLALLFLHVAPPADRVKPPDNASAVIDLSVRRVVGDGAITGEDAEREVGVKLPSIALCYKRALIRIPGLGGVLAAELAVSKKGTVTAVELIKVTLENREMEACLRQRLAQWTFSKRSLPTTLTMELVFAKKARPEEPPATAEPAGAP